MQKVTFSFVMSVRLSSYNNLAPTGRIFMKFIIWVFFEQLSRNFKLHYNQTSITGTLHEDRYTFLIISLSILLRMRSVLDKCCTENQNTHFTFSDDFSKIVPFMRCGKNTVDRGRPHMKIWRMRIACLISKATVTHSEYVILYCFSSTTMITRARLGVTSHVTRTLPVWLFIVCQPVCSSLSVIR
jgi:hypothetical protein